jgi:hypothetical protein
MHAVSGTANFSVHALAYVSVPKILMIEPAETATASSVKDSTTGMKTRF